MRCSDGFVFIVLFVLTAQGADVKEVAAHQAVKNSFMVNSLLQATPLPTALCQLIAQYDEMRLIKEISMSKALAECPPMLVLAQDRIAFMRDESERIEIWDMAGGCSLQSLKTHAHEVRFLVKISDHIIASGSLDGTIKTWDIVTGNCLRTLQDPTGEMDCLERLSNNAIVSASKGSVIKVWDSVSGECTKELGGGCGATLCLATLSDRVIVSGHLGGNIQIWDVLSGFSRRSLKARSSVTAVQKLSDDTIVSTEMDGRFCVWESSTGEVLRTWGSNYSSSFKLDRAVDYHLITLSKNIVLSAIKDTSLEVWDGSAARCLQYIEDYGYPVRPLSVDGQLFSYACSGSKLREWEYSHR